MRRPSLPRPVRLGLVLVAVLGTLYATTRGTTPQPTSTISVVLDKVRAGDVTAAEINDGSRLVTVTLDDGRELSATFPVLGGADLATTIADAGADVRVVTPTKPSAISSIVGIVLPIVLIGAMMLLVLRVFTRGNARFGNGKDAAVDQPTTRFADVAGCDEAIEDLREIVDYLRDPAAYTASGAEPPCGILLDGPPGTGKTLLARAVAGEADTKYFSVSGSDFVEMYAGVGAARVRRLFQAARKAGRAVVFIDEIEAIGRARSSQTGTPGERELENTLNQLLVELDGFAGSNVIVLAATNRPDLLDAALVRPGRFDRRITVGLPDRPGREAILAVHTRGRVLADDVDLTMLARRTPGMSGAELANVVKTAARLAARGARPAITDADLSEALAQIAMGRARTNAVQTDRDRLITAWHEAGHALCALVSPDHTDPVQVTIVPRGQAGGVTWMSGSDESFLTRVEARARLAVILGGRAAEEILLDGEHTQGASSDLVAATDLATNMVCAWGMGRRGLMVRRGPDALDDPEVRAEVNELLADALADAHRLLADNRPLVDATVAALLDRETLTAADLETLRQRSH